jgi:hypothetical protein
MCISSMPARGLGRSETFLNPGMSGLRRLIVRWYRPTRLLRYLDWRILMGVSRSSLMASSAATLARLLSMVTVSGRLFLSIDFKVTPGCHLFPMSAEQKVNGVAVFVDGPVKIPPFALDADVRLVHSPAFTNRPPASAKRFPAGSSLMAPAVHSRMIDRNVGLSHHFFEVPQDQRIGHVQAHTGQDQSTG